MRLSLLGLPAGNREKAGTGPAPPRCIATGLGARVARLRCPILRAGMGTISEEKPKGNLPAGSRECEKRKKAFIINRNCPISVIDIVQLPTLKYLDPKILTHGIRGIGGGSGQSGGYVTLNTRISGVSNARSILTPRSLV